MLILIGLVVRAVEASGFRTDQSTRLFGNMLEINNLRECNVRAFQNVCRECMPGVSGSVRKCPPVGVRKRTGVRYRTLSKKCKMHVVSVLRFWHGDCDGLSGEKCVR